MVTDLDFEEIDDLMGRMDDAKDLTEAIAADVAKVLPKTKNQKKTSKKVAPKKAKTISKNPAPAFAPEPVKPIVKSKKVVDISEAKPVEEEKAQAQAQAQAKTSEPESVPEDGVDGTKVAVRILTKYAEEPEEPVYKPNPRTGKFMDMVSPKNDMTIANKQTSKIIPVATIISTEETTIKTIEAIEDNPTEELIDNQQDDRDRLEKNGLDPDATVEEMMDMADTEDGDEFLEGLMKNLGDDIEDDIKKTITETEENADIVSFPDRSDAFLSELDIEKRPLGGSAVSSSGVIASDKETIADEAFIEDKTDNKWLEKEKKSSRKDRNKHVKNQIENKSVTAPSKKKKGRVGQTLLYLGLILALAVFGGTLGALAYFSGLF